MKDGGIGFDTNKSTQQRRKVEMRKGKKTEIMKRNQALNTEGGKELVARRLRVCIGLGVGVRYRRVCVRVCVGGVISSC